MDPLKAFATADNITAVLVAATVHYGLGLSVARRTFLRRRGIRDRLNSLGPLVNDEYVRGLFGAPAYGRLDDAGAGTLVWDVRAGYLAVLFERNAARVLEFTLTDRRLRFDVRSFSQGIAEGRLGRSSFARMMDAGSGTFRLGARRVSYVEEAYIGNAGGYCTAYLSYSDAGADTLMLPDSLPPAGEISWSLDGPNIDQAFVDQLRRGSAPNTVAVSIDVSGAPSLPLADLDVLRLRKR